LAKRVDLLAKQIQRTQVEGENVLNFKYFNITMDKYVFNSHFYVIDMDDVDIILGYPWMASLGMRWASKLMLFTLPNTLS
jgi:hypothetical protein